MIFILLIVLDQIFKYLAFKFKPSFDIIGDFLKIEYIQNTGTIFGLFENSNWMFMILAFILCIIISFYMKKNVPKKSIKEKAFMLILAGGIGNLIDRLFRGFVVDFISLKFIGIFNFADCYVVIGVLIILLLEVRELYKNGETSKKSDFRS